MSAHTGTRFLIMPPVAGGRRRASLIRGSRATSRALLGLALAARETDSEARGRPLGIS